MQAALDELWTIQLIVLIILVIPVTPIPSVTTSHQFLDLTLFTLSCHPILQVLLELNEVGHVCLEQLVLLEDNHQFIGSHIEPMLEPIKGALDPFDGRGQVECLLDLI